MKTHTFRTRRPTWRPGPRAPLPVLVAAGVLLGLGMPGLGWLPPGADGTRGGPVLVEAHGQALQSREDAARARYVQVRDEFDALQDEALQLERRVIQLSQTLDNYRAFGNRRALEDAFINDYIPQAFRLQALNIQSDAAKAALDEARRNLLRILREGENALLDELDRGATPARQQAIGARIVEIRQEVGRLEREREPLAEVGFRPVPRLEAAPTDGPDELRSKAGYLERTAESFASQVAFLDEEIRIRENRLRLERGSQDARDGIVRFDGDRPVGTGPVTRAPGAQGADERAGDGGVVTVAFSELPLAEQIQRLLSVRTQAEEARDESLSRASELRRIAVERGGGPG
jgi:hypothetical protein